MKRSRMPAVVTILVSGVFLALVGLGEEGVRLDERPGDGLIGLMVGNGSGGDFAGFKITPAPGGK